MFYSIYTTYASKPRNGRSCCWGICYRRGTATTTLWHVSPHVKKCTTVILQEKKQIHRFQLPHVGKVGQANLLSSKNAWDFTESVEVDSWVFCLTVSTGNVAYSAPLTSFFCNLLFAAAHFQAFSIIWLSCQHVFGERVKITHFTNTYMRIASCMTSWNWGPHSSHFHVSFNMSLVTGFSVSWSFTLLDLICLTVACTSSNDPVWRNVSFIFAPEENLQLEK